jgi:hypothetical protein
MHAITVNSATGESFELSIEEGNEPDLESFLENVERLSGVKAAPKPEAFACGYRGCRLTDYLAELYVEGVGTRVLCPIHVLDLVERECDLE